MYLGHPLGGRPCSKIFWSDLIHQLENRLTPWKKSFLNNGGRLNLIKAVMSSIPIYYMSVFKIPVGIAKRILEKFFLGMVSRRGRFIRLWETMCKDRNKVDKNKGLMAKRVWRFGRE
ncbi:hypothetical protein Dsin_000981 [Dipteronia sinensis]|uniref:Uncharacterized protein n=1 Tax=Dipteronia sinensis TaxID=43782 RepID=A0AAE0B4F7_9ROSI|nr:hypothetical protein Dsin_000981 [Dipteronia sinensis]